MLVEIHMVQNHAPSNLNRDDTGSPKDCIFGGALRARISSQCLKRSIRQSEIFRRELDGQLGKRTRGLPGLLREELLRLGCTPEEAETIAKKATEIGSGKASNEGETRQLIFIDPRELSQLARDLKALFGREGQAAFAQLPYKKLEAAVTRGIPRSVDIALFGRMTTSDAFEDAKASLQVAHAFSTGKVEKQYDYFTAVDDLLKPSDDPGAGMIGDVEFNSATYYKYFALHWEQLVGNLGGDADTALLALSALVRAAAFTTPSGKQNTFAAHNQPDLILIEVKHENLPSSYANAFLKPVRPRPEEDIVGASIRELSGYSAQLKRAYGLQPAVSHYLAVRGESVQASEAVDTIDDLISNTRAAIRETQPAL